MLLSQPFQEFYNVVMLLGITQEERIRITAPDQDWFLRLHTPIRYVTSTSLQNKCLDRYNFRISQNIIRRLAANDLRLGRAPTGPLLTRERR